EERSHALHNTSQFALIPHSVGASGKDLDRSMLPALLCEPPNIYNVTRKVSNVPRAIAGPMATAPEGGASRPWLPDRMAPVDNRPAAPIASNTHPGPCQAARMPHTTANLASPPPKCRPYAPLPCRRCFAARWWKKLNNSHHAAPPASAAGCQTHAATIAHKILGHTTASAMPRDRQSTTARSAIATPSAASTVPIIDSPPNSCSPAPRAFLCPAME